MKILHTLPKTALLPLARIMVTMAPLLLRCIITLTWLPILLGGRKFLRLLRLPYIRSRRVADCAHLNRLHTITVAGKKLTNLFYSKTYTRSYYLGCSLGGRQGIKAAEMFPGDFDGIVAGSPALDFNNCNPGEQASSSSPVRLTLPVSFRRHCGQP